MRPTSTASAFEQEFPFGWRYVKRVSTDGVEAFDQVPLTLEDVLHPQRDDVIPQNTCHESDCRYLAEVFRSQTFGPLHTLVSRDLLINWGVEGMPDHSPDVAVFVGLNREPDRSTSVLDLASYGGRCELVVEVVSPPTRELDVVRKFDHYRQIGIPLYVIVDQESWDGPRRLLGFRRTPSGFAVVEPDERGRIALPPMALSLTMTNGRVVCHDLQSGKVMPDYATARRLLELYKEFQSQSSRLQQWLDEDKKCREQLQRLGELIEVGYGRYCELREQLAALEEVAHLDLNG